MREGPVRGTINLAAAANRYFSSHKRLFFAPKSFAKSTACVDRLGRSTRPEHPPLAP
jgi:hypothetical protein